MSVFKSLLLGIVLFLPTSAYSQELEPRRWAHIPINGVDKNDTRKDVAWALSYGFRLLPRLSMKVAYIGTKTHADTGIRSDSVAIAFSTFW